MLNCINYFIELNEFYNDFNGRVNSAFAKIPITNYPNGALFDSKNGYLINLKTFVPPKERISVLEFKFIVSFVLFRGY